MTAPPLGVVRAADVRRTGVDGRGARALVEALHGHATMEYLGINGGRRMR
jgi:hypothetical protein